MPTFGSGLGLDLITPLSANPITIDLQTSRVSGVAPLTVFFDGTGTTCTGVSRPFHYLGHKWDFDDAGSYLPTATGACSTHVFNGPGTYTVTYSVQNENGDSAFETVDVTVTDPDDVFAGTDTICAATDGDFTGAPSGCVQVTTSSFDTVLTYLANGKRVLMKRGQTFTATAPAEVNITTGPAYLGAWGTGTSPDARGIYANNPVVSSQVAIEANTIPVRGVDVRICDIAFVEGATSAQQAGVIGATHRCDDVLVHRCKTTGFWSSVSFSQDLINYYGVSPHEGCTISQCWFEDGRITTTYIGGVRMAILGCHYDVNLSSHLCRVTFLDQGVIQGNVMDTPGATRHAIKLHANQNRTLYGDYTQDVVISQNTFMGDDNAWLVAIAPQDASPNGDERIRDVLCERNLTIALHGVQVAYYTDCIQSTFRNNVIVRPESVTVASNLQGWWIVQRGATSPVPSEIEILNNTIHDASADSGTEQILVMVDDYTGVEIRLWNNAIDTPGLTNFVTYPGQSGFSDSQGNITSNTATITFDDPSTYDFHPSAGTSLLGAGVAAPVFYDFDGVARTNDDVGALERAP